MEKKFDWDERMITKIRLPIQSILLISIICLTVLTQPTMIQSQPLQCTFGEIDAWINIDGKNWLNTTVSELSLHCGQIFFVKTKITSSMDDIWLALYLFEPGTTNTNHESFIIINGPCQLNDGIDLGKTHALEDKIVVWKMKVKDDPSWKGGITPLSITGFFQKQTDDEWITEDISFSIAAINILENETNDDSVTLNSEQHQSSFLSSNLIIIPLITLCLIAISLIKRKK